MRIVGGTLRGRKIAAPETSDIRPTSDRVRESLFNILSHGVDDFSLDGAHVLDLFAGTGALGLEAISRGAESCLFVDDGAEARGLIRTNIEAFGLSGVTRLYRRDATALGPANARDVASLVFLDPPYGKGLAEAALASALSGGWLAAGALAVIEERDGVDVVLPAALTPVDRRVYGDTQIIIARYAKQQGASRQPIAPPHSL